MKRSALALAGIGLFALASTLHAQEVQRSAVHDFRIVTVAEGLENT